MEDFDKVPCMKDVRAALRGEGMRPKADMILKLSVVREDVWMQTSSMDGHQVHIKSFQLSRKVHHVATGKHISE